MRGWLLLASLSLLVVGCSGSGLVEEVEPEGSSKSTASGETRNTTLSGGEKLPTTARIMCDEVGTRMLTPKVKARPDGVHFVIDNRLDSAPGFAVGHRGGGLGGNAPTGESEHVEPLPPGSVEIGCYEPLPGGDFGEPDYENLKVVDEDNYYKPMALECASGIAVAGSISSASSGRSGELTGEPKSPVELTRRRFSDRLESRDTVEPAGYPEARGERIVRVVRDERVLAAAHYYRARGGWLGDSVTRCDGFSTSGD